MPREGYYTLNQQGKADLAAKISAFLSGRREIVFAFLHGSFLTEEFFRDIDLGIYLTPMPQGGVSAYEISLSCQLEAEMKLAFPVEVKIINRAPVSFSFQVLGGKVLFCRDEDRLTDYMEATARKYLDFAPLRRHYIREAMA
jgi:predicted nucleotidyltransferase